MVKSAGEILTRLISSKGKVLKEPRALKSYPANKKVILAELAAHPHHFRIAEGYVVDTQAKSGQTHFGKWTGTSLYMKKKVKEAMAEGLTTKQLARRFKTDPGHYLVMDTPTGRLGRIRRGVKTKMTKDPMSIVEGSIISKFKEPSDMAGAITHTQTVKKNEGSWKDFQGLKASGNWKKKGMTAIVTITGSNGNVGRFEYVGGSGVRIAMDDVRRHLFSTKGAGSPDPEKMEGTFVEKWGQTAHIQTVWLPTPEAKKMRHRLKDNSNNDCVMKAIMDHTTSKRTHARVKSWMKKNGFPDVDDLKIICNQGRVHVYNQAGVEIDAQLEGHGTTFHFHLTEKDHIESTNPLLKPQDLPQTICDVQEEFSKHKDKMWMGTSTKPSLFWTRTALYKDASPKATTKEGEELETNWQCQSSSSRDSAEFIHDNNLGKNIISARREDLFRFVSQSCHYIGQDSYSPDLGEGYDINKMYAAAIKKAEVPSTGKLHFLDVTECDPDQVIKHCGVTQVFGLEDVPLQLQRFVVEGMIMPNSLLRFLRAQGATFKCHVSAWTNHTQHLSLRDSHLYEKNYATFVGRMDAKSKNQLWWKSGTREEMADIEARAPGTIIATTEDAYAVKPHKEKALPHFNRCHVATQILGEAMLMVWEELIKHDHDDVIGIRTDAIYFKKGTPAPPIGPEPGQWKKEDKIGPMEGYLVNPELAYSDDTLAMKAGWDLSGDLYFDTDGIAEPWEIESTGFALTRGYPGTSKSYLYENRGRGVLIACPTNELRKALKCDTSTHHTAFHLKVNGKEAGWDNGKPIINLDYYHTVVIDEGTQFVGNWAKAAALAKEHHCDFHVILDVDKWGRPRQLLPVESEFNWYGLTVAMPGKVTRVKGLDDIKRQSGQLKDLIKGIYKARTNKKIVEFLGDRILKGNREDVAASIVEKYVPLQDTVIVPTHKDRMFLASYDIEAQTCHSMIGKSVDCQLFVCTDAFEECMLYTAAGRLRGSSVANIHFFSLRSEKS